MRDDQHQQHIDNMDQLIDNLSKREQAKERRERFGRWATVWVWPIAGLILGAIALLVGR